MCASQYCFNSSNLLFGSQAELRALEEGDGSAGGSSPCSETSQETSGPRGLLKSKRWKTAFLSPGSPDSNSRGSDLQDNAETSESKGVGHRKRVESGTMFKFLLNILIKNS